MNHLEVLGPISFYSQHVASAKRQQSLKLFVEGKTKILVTTQALSRGVPFIDCNLVINFEVPVSVRNHIDRNVFINQISRAVAMNEKGFAITLTSENGPTIHEDGILLN